MGDKLVKNLRKDDIITKKFMIFVYILDMIFNVTMIISSWTANLETTPGWFLNITYTAFASMFMIIDIILLRETLKRGDEYDKLWCLPTFSVVLAVELIIDQVHIIVSERNFWSPDGVISSQNIFFVGLDLLLVAIYLKRYFSLKNRYSSR